MQDEVARVARGRMFTTGLSQLLIGLVWSIGPIVRFASDAGAARVDSRVIAAVVILWPLGFPILLRGLALLQQALGEAGHFRAGAEGIELRIGAPSLYTRLIGIIPQIRALPANPDTFAIRFPAAGAEWDANGYVYRFAGARSRPSRSASSRSSSCCTRAHACCCGVFILSRTRSRSAGG